MYSCRIVPRNNQHDAIPLEHNKPLVIGRGPLTKIKDPRLSRNQIELVADCNLGLLNVKCVGPNPCTAANKKLTQDCDVDLKHNDSFELLENQYPYQVEFWISNLDMVGKQTTLNHFLTNKRKNADEGKQQDDDQSPAKKKKGEDSWEELEDGNLIIFTTHGVQHQSKIAAFDMDGTIITTQSGKVFPTNSEDWKIYLSEIPAKLKQLIADDFKIVILTNQAGFKSGKVKPSEFRQKLVNISSKLGVPLQVFISPGEGIFRKPRTGTWNHLVNKANGGIEVDMSSSFYCGDAAGREENWAPKKKKDHSSVDRLLALNLGLKFYTPEEYFLGHRPVPHRQPAFLPHSLEEKKPLLDPPDAPLYEKTQEIILMIGFPGSGKSRFSTEHALKSNYQIINRDALGSWQKCAALMEKVLDAGKSVLIDNTNPDKESRSRFVQLATARGLSCRAFVMNVPLTHARHNNKFRELTDKKHAPISQMVFNIYKKKYQEPSPEEGFSQIVSVNFLPEFNSIEDERLYKMFLLED